MRSSQSKAVDTPVEISQKIKNCHGVSIAPRALITLDESCKGSGFPKRELSVRVTRAPDTVRPLGKSSKRELLEGAKPLYEELPVIKCRHEHSCAMTSKFDSEHPFGSKSPHATSRGLFFRWRVPLRVEVTSNLAP